MKQQKLLPVKSFSPLTLAVAMLVLTVATATTAEAQTFSVLYTFGSNTGDPYNTQYPGLIAQGRDGDLYSNSLKGVSSRMLRQQRPDTTFHNSQKILDLTWAGWLPLWPTVLRGAQCRDDSAPRLRSSHRDASRPPRQNNRISGTHHKGQPKGHSKIQDLQQQEKQVGL
jgi:hypothetical protein